MIDWTKPIRFKERKKRHIPVRVIATDLRRFYPVLIAYGDKGEELRFDNKDGCLSPQFAVENVPESKSRFFHVYQHFLGVPHSSIELANKTRGITMKSWGVLEYIYEGNEVVDVVFHKKGKK